MLKEIMDKSPNPHLPEERARALATLPGRAFPNLGLILSQDEEEFERIISVVLYWVADAYDGDTLALGAVLRGPLVGLTEQELLDVASSLPQDRGEFPRVSNTSASWAPVEEPWCT